MKRYLSLFLTLAVMAPSVVHADLPAARPGDEVRPGATVPSRPDDAFRPVALERGAPALTSTNANAAANAPIQTAVTGGTLSAPVATELRTAITGPSSSVPFAQRQPMAEAAVALYAANPDVRAAVDAAPAGQKGNVLLALTAMKEQGAAPATITAAANLIVANPGLVTAPTAGRPGTGGALAQPNLNSTDRAAILTVLSAPGVPVTDAGLLARNPAAARTIAAIPAAGRAEAMGIVRTVATNPTASISQTALAVASPEGRAFLITLSPDQQKTLAPTLGNTQVRNAVLNLNGADADETKTMRIEATTILTAVLKAPASSSNPQTAMLTAAITAVQNDGARGVLMQMPPAQVGAAAVTLGRSEPLRTALNNLAMPDAQKATLVAAIVPIPNPRLATSQATPLTASSPLVVSLTRVLGNPVVADTIAAMPVASQQNAIVLLGGNSENATALRAAIGNMGGTDALRATFVTAMVASPDGVAAINAMKAGNNPPLASIRALVTNANQAAATLNTPGMPDVIAALPPTQQVTAMIQLGNPPGVAGNATRAAVAGTPGGATVAAGMVSTLMNNNALNSGNITATLAVLGNAQFNGANVPVADRGRVAAILAQSGPMVADPAGGPRAPRIPAGLVAFNALPAAARPAATEFLTNIAVPANAAQANVVVAAINVIGLPNVTANLNAIPAGTPADRTRALLNVASGRFNANSLVGATPQSISNAFAFQLPVVRALFRG